MRKFRLRAAFAASLLRDLFLACAWAVSRPFLIAARGFDALARPCGARLVERQRPKPLTAAARDVLAERQRQIDVEGWTPEHDDAHDDGSLAFAASAYAIHAANERAQIDLRIGCGRQWHLAGWLALSRLVWPESWSFDWWKPRDRRSNLVRAGALIIAEIERLDRASTRAAERN